MKLKKMDQSKLDNLKFKCRNISCQAQHKYIEAMKHSSTCDIKDWCVFCGVNLINMPRELHVLESCDKTKFYCSKCECEFPQMNCMMEDEIKAILNHSCFNEIKKRAREESRVEAR